MTIDAHIAHNDRLTDAQRSLLFAEQTAGVMLISGLERATGAYSTFLYSGHMRIRAELRVANYLADVQMLETQGLLLPHRRTIAQLISGGVSAVFSKKPMSRVLRAGHALTAKLAHDAAAEVSKISGVGGLPVMTEVADRLDVVGDRIDGLLEKLDTEIEPQRRPLKLAVERAVLELREGLEQMDGRLRAEFTPLFIESLYPELSRRARAVADDEDEDDDETESAEEA